MRTVKRNTLKINTKKQTALEMLCLAYAREKRYWLQRFQAWDFQAQLGKPRIIRDKMIEQNYRSAFGLQARHWKLALEDAAETWDKYWQSIFVDQRESASDASKKATNIQSW